MYIEYAPALAPQSDLLLRTRVRSRTSRPWLILSGPLGENERPVVPGQYAVWSPHAHTVDEAGAAIALGPEEDASAEPDDESDTPIEMRIASGEDGPAAAVDDSDCGCAAPGAPGSERSLAAALLVALLGWRRRRRE